MQMKRLLYLYLLFVACCLISVASACAAEENDAFDLLDDDFYQEDYQPDSSVQVEVNDPLESMNRVFFEVNDTFYYWVVKPVKKGYAAVLPWDVRYVLGNFFYHISSPIRLVNNLLQGDFEDAGIVLYRFVINTTMGGWGFGDPAAREFGIAPRPADFGQTLGKWGVGEGVYICWPILGPSDIRDTVGIFGDGYAHPLYFSVTKGLVANSAYYIGTNINEMSLQEQDVYEELKRISVDPYVAMRQAYLDYRRALVAQ